MKLLCKSHTKDEEGKGENIYIGAVIWYVYLKSSGGWVGGSWGCMYLGYYIETMMGWKVNKYRRGWKKCKCYYFRKRKAYILLYTPIFNTRNSLLQKVSLFVWDG